jgi:hypothetical protein
MKRLPGSCRKIIAVCVVIFSGIASSAVYAFGADGHQAVGAIADALLQGTAAEKQVRAILGDVQGEKISLQAAAVWPDCVRAYAVDADGELMVPDKKQKTANICQLFASEKAGRDAMKDYVRRNNSNCDYAGEHLDCHKSYHFTDIAIQQAAYSENAVGASHHDVVHAINAAILVLQNKPAPAPFSIKDKREALFMLAHFVGDIHQPLHVGAVYLDENGRQVNPDHGGDEDRRSTRGGNSLKINKRGNLHADWDATNVMGNAKLFPQLVDRTAQIKPMSGNMLTWSALWANESLAVARNAFRPLRMGPADVASHQWPVEFEDRKAYLKYAHVVKDEQIAKAGARLSQVLQDIWPD